MNHLTLFGNKSNAQNFSNDDSRKNLVSTRLFTEPNGDVFLAKLREVIDTAHSRGNVVETHYSTTGDSKSIHHCALLLEYAILKINPETGEYE